MYEHFRLRCAHRSCVSLRDVEERVSPTTRLGKVAADFAVIALVAGAFLEAELVADRVEAAGARVSAHRRGPHVPLLGAGEMHRNGGERWLEGRGKAVWDQRLTHPPRHRGRVAGVVRAGKAWRNDMAHVHRWGARPVLRRRRLRRASEERVMRVHALRL